MPMKKFPDRLLVLLGEARNLDQDSSILMSVLFFVAPE
jgi:hypothetical protein